MNAATLPAPPPHLRQSVEKVYPSLPDPLTQAREQLRMLELSDYEPQLIMHDFPSSLRTCAHGVWPWRRDLAAALRMSEKACYYRLHQEQVNRLNRNGTPIKVAQGLNLSNFQECPIIRDGRERVEPCMTRVTRRKKGVRFHVMPIVLKHHQRGEGPPSDGLSVYLPGPVEITSMITATPGLLSLVHSGEMAINTVRSLNAQYRTGDKTLVWTLVRANGEWVILPGSFQMEECLVILGFPTLDRPLSSAHR